MINAILTGIFKIVTKLILLLLSPINALITSMLPDFSNMLTNVGNFFSTGATYFGYIVDSLFLNSEVVSFLILYWTFKLTFPFLVSLIKLVVKWYDKLKL